jgi:hypothetical protein
MAIGDTNPALGSTAGTLSHVLPEKPEFILHGGDIQYYESRIETWASWFPVMQPMLSQGAFFPAIGNHENEQSDELSQYALRFFGGAGFDGKDTYYRFENGGVWFFSIVFFHKPFLTCGDTGDNPAARTWLEPIFLQYKVLFVLQAHMHGYERFELPNGLTYITTAGGGGLLGDTDANTSRDYCVDRVASGAFYHAMIFSVGATDVSAKAIDQDGMVRDTFSKPIP